MQGELQIGSGGFVTHDEFTFVLRVTPRQEAGVSSEVGVTSDTLRQFVRKKLEK